MNFNDLSENNWHREPPADAAIIQELLLQSALDLPADYLNYLRFSNGVEGDLGDSVGWCSLWPAEEVIQLNRDYEIQQWVPGFFCIGSDGGGEGLCFDTRTPQPWKIYKIPFSSLAESEAMLLVDNFAALIESLNQADDN